MNVERVYQFAGRLFAPESIFFLMLALSIVTVAISIVPVFNLLFAARIEETTTDGRLKLGKILRTISHMLLGVLTIIKHNVTFYS